MDGEIIIIGGTARMVMARRVEIFWPEIDGQPPVIEADRKPQGPLPLAGGSTGPGRDRDIPALRT